MDRMEDGEKVEAEIFLMRKAKYNSDEGGRLEETSGDLRGTAISPLKNRGKRKIMSGQYPLTGKT